MPWLSQAVTVRTAMYGTGRRRWRRKQRMPAALHRRYAAAQAAWAAAAETQAWAARAPVHPSHCSAWMSTITLDRCELTSGDGGGGGNGGKGGKGGPENRRHRRRSATLATREQRPTQASNPAKAATAVRAATGQRRFRRGRQRRPLVRDRLQRHTPTRLNGTTVAHGAGGTKGTGGAVDNVKAPDGIVGAAADDFAVP